VAIGPPSWDIATAIPMPRLSGRRPQLVVA
jgi:hypothetical protein